MDQSSELKPKQALFVRLETQRPVFLQSQYVASVLILGRDSGSRHETTMGGRTKLKCRADLFRLRLPISQLALLYSLAALWSHCIAHTAAPPAVCWFN